MTSSLEKHGLRDEQANRELLKHVHPDGWRNPTPSGPYNLVVIGAGTAGLVTAAGAAGLGAKVALIEKGLMGGDCLNVGCVPSKGIIRGARAIADVLAGTEFGVSGVKTAKIDFTSVMQRMRQLRAKISPHDSASRFRDLGVDVYFGAARFISRNALEVKGEHLEFSKAVIATGGRPRVPQIQGIEQIDYHTNETIFELNELPARLIVLGAGPIGIEMAQAFSRLGSKVWVVTHGPRILTKEDSDVSALIERKLEQEGVSTLKKRKALKFVRRGDKKVLVLAKEDTTQDEVEADEVLLSVGRLPNLEGLDLGAAGVASDDAGIRVDDFLRTTNSKIYAAGDVCSKFKFTHAAEAMSRIAIQNALFFGRKRVSNLHIPWTTYTDPEVSHVGIKAEAAQIRSDVETIDLSFEKNDRAILDGETEGFIRVHYRSRKGNILGATLVAKNAGDMMGEIVMAMNHDLGVGDLATTIHAYPSKADLIRQVGNEYQRGRVSPGLKGILRRYFQFLR